MAVDMTRLKELRERTGVSFALCKKALELTNNDVTTAVKKLQELAGEKIEEKSKRTTSAGGIFSYIHHNKKIAAMVELASETDFVSGNADFHKVGQEIALHIASMPAKTVEELLEQEYVRDTSKKIKDLIK
ncbi:MAG: elongation factor Ts, partial [Candidatus Roizmanbacteria bacterium]|nr:elongation factor Ts [Candidatus Roizmanbacteria bacterium]